MSKQILILGGGISGLAAGIYAQKMGFQSQIFERNLVPGGECTGWDRKGYHIDGCIHWLTGSGEGSELGRIWRETGALNQGIKILQPESFGTVNANGVIVSLYCDITKLRTHLLEISPGDNVEIDRLCQAIKIFQNTDIPVTPPDMMRPLELYHFIRRMSGSNRMMKQFQLPLSEYASRFQHPAIRQALTAFLPSDNSAYILPYNMGVVSSGNGGRPVGGSRALALRMADQYQSMGGDLHLGEEVSRIQIQNKKATGIALSDGTIVSADYMIPAMDIHITLEKLLEGKYPNHNITDRDGDPTKYPVTTCVYAAFGIDEDLSDIPVDVSLTVPVFPFEDRERNRITFRHYSYEPGFAPDHKSVGVVCLYADYDWWKNKHINREAYRMEKKRLSQALSDALQTTIPKLKGKITTLDVATPITYERYCGAWRGAWMSYGPSQGSKPMLLNGRIKGIDNLFMAGQWLMPPGGLAIAMLTGKWAIQRLCKKENLNYRW